MTQTPSTTTKRTLRDILDERESLETEVMMRQGEITDEMADLFTMNADEMRQKIQNYVDIVAVLENESEAQKEKADKHYARSKALANTAKSIDDNLKHLMTFAGLKRIEGIENDVTISPTKDALIFNEDPKHWEFTPYLVQTIEKHIDKEALRSALEAGLSIDGARLEPRFSLRKPLRKVLKGKS